MSAPRSVTSDRVTSHPVRHKETRKFYLFPYGAVSDTLVYKKFKTQSAARQSVPGRRQGEPGPYRSRPVKGRPSRALGLSLVSTDTARTLCHARYSWGQCLPSTTECTF